MFAWSRSTCSLGLLRFFKDAASCLFDDREYSRVMYSFFYGDRKKPIDHIVQTANQLHPVLTRDLFFDRGRDWNDPMARLTEDF